ncbi:hypothetical protein DMH18_26120 [Streptomyces sp. WAC 06783]|uniref:hypothetical protein n=1 Tax=Streptomyces sp. WAC 06783 TaxID=2203211 RepID=UPI000F7416BB|nr:hypothetical protein [Streptomyces sp. WAC 06783]RSO06932.1 hypothetical protein DMH18_26120 [Streptomyces sp. WAC 06783]
MSQNTAGTSEQAAGPAQERNHEAASFTTRIVKHAIDAGIWDAVTPPAQKALENYLLVAHVAASPRYAHGHPPVPRWQECADLMGRYTLVVGSGDYGIYDALVHRDAPQAEQHRLDAATHHLVTALQARDPLPAPQIAGGPFVAALGGEYQSLIRGRAARAHPQVLAAWRADITQLLHTMLLFRAADFSAFPLALTRSLAEGATVPAAALHQAAERHGERLPAVLRDRLAQLMGSPRTADRDELLVLLGAIEAGNTIGAGLFFRTAALHAHADEIPDTALPLLDTAGHLANAAIRIGNDLCALTTAGPDESDGSYVWTGLHPTAHPPHAPEDADAVHHIQQVCTRTQDWLANALADAIRALWHESPWLGAICCRLSHLGIRTYAVRHYALLTRTQHTNTFDELDHPAEHPFLTRCQPDWNPADRA